MGDFIAGFIVGTFILIIVAASAVQSKNDLLRFCAKNNITLEKCVPEILEVAK